MKILITTPDYPPKIGGLSTFTINIEKILKDMGHQVEVLQWRTVQDIKEYPLSNDIQYIFNIHFQGGFFLKKSIHCPIINFVHGSEVFFTSKNIIKNLVKKFLKKKIIHYFEQSYLNIFISQATQNILKNQGLTVDYQRDIIFHNCIKTKEAHYTEIEDLEDLSFCSIARDVPHKNLTGCVYFCEQIAKITKKDITLYLTSEKYQSSSIKIVNISGINDTEKNNIYQKSQFNLLFSLDHSNKGFIEGFGLTCLEAGIFGTPSIVLNTGGLPENVHHLINGYVLNDLSSQQIKNCCDLLFSNKPLLSQMRQKTHHHTLESHGVDQYQKLFNRLLVS